MEGRESTRPSRSSRSSQRRESIPTKDNRRLSQDMLYDPWPVTKINGRKDKVLEAAQVLVRARNSELVNECGNAVVLLPASGPVSGYQGGSPERPLYSLRSPKFQPFKVHLWQTPAVRTWNETKLSWNATPGRIMVHRGLKSEPLNHFLKTLGVTKSQAKVADLCNHFRCWRSLNTREGWLNQYPKYLHGVVYQKWWSFNGFRFLELPPELREIILKFALGRFAAPFARLWPAKRDTQFPTPNMRLALVNKQLNFEVIAALSAHTTFHFHSIQQLLRVFSQRNGSSRVIFRRLKELRYVELQLSPNDLLRLFGVSFVFGVRETRYECSSTFDLGAIFDGDPPLCHQMRINIQHIFLNDPRPNHTCCQKVHNTAFWAGARARLRNIAVVEFVGYIDETQRKEWIAEHVLERKGIVPEATDFAGWQRGIWTRWYSHNGERPHTLSTLLTGLQQQGCMRMHSKMQHFAYLAIIDVKPALTKSIPALTVPDRSLSTTAQYSIRLKTLNSSAFKFLVEYVSSW